MGSGSSVNQQALIDAQERALKSEEKANALQKEINMLQAKQIELLESEKKNFLEELRGVVRQAANDGGGGWKGSSGSPQIMPQSEVRPASKTDDDLDEGNNFAEKKAEKFLNEVNDRVDQANKLADEVGEKVELGMMAVEKISGEGAVDFLNDNFEEISNKVLGPIAELVTEFPFLGPVGTAMKMALSTAQQVRGNKAACEDLGGRVAEVGMLLSELMNASMTAEKGAKIPPGALAIHLKKLADAINDANEFMKNFSGRGFFSKMLNASSDAGKFVELDDAMAKIMEDMSLAVQVKIMMMSAKTFGEVKALGSKIDRMGGASEVSKNPQLMKEVASSAGISENAFKEEMAAMGVKLDEMNSKLDGQMDILLEIKSSMTIKLRRPEKPSRTEEVEEWLKKSPADVYTYVQYANECLTLDFSRDVAVPYSKFEISMDNLMDAEAEELGLSGFLRGALDKDKDGSVGKSEWSRLHRKWVKSGLNNLYDFVKIQAENNHKKPNDRIVAVEKTKSEMNRPSPPSGFSPFEGTSEFLNLGDKTIALYSYDTGKFLSYTTEQGFLRQVYDKKSDSQYNFVPTGDGDDSFYVTSAYEDAIWSGTFLTCHPSLRCILTSDKSKACKFCLYIEDKDAGNDKESTTFQLFDKTSNCWLGQDRQMFWNHFIKNCDAEEGCCGGFGLKFNQKTSSIPRGYRPLSEDEISGLNTDEVFALYVKESNKHFSYIDGKENWCRSIYNKSMSRWKLKSVQEEGGRASNLFYIVNKYPGKCSGHALAYSNNPDGVLLTGDKSFALKFKLHINSTNNDLYTLQAIDYNNRDDLWLGLDNNKHWNVLEDYEEACAIEFISLVANVGVPKGYRRCEDELLPSVDKIYSIVQNDNDKFAMACDGSGWVRPNFTDVKKSRFRFEKCEASIGRGFYRIVCAEEGSKYCGHYLSFNMSGGCVGVYPKKVHGAPIQIFVNDEGMYQFLIYLPDSLIDSVKSWEGCEIWHKMWIGMKNEDETKFELEDNWCYIVEYSKARNLANWRLVEE